MGTQDPFIVAVQDERQKAILSGINAEIMGAKSDPFYGAPTQVYVFAPAGNPNNVKDGSLVLMKSWHLPEGLMGVGSLALGYPDGEPHAAKPRKDDYARVIK